MPAEEFWLPGRVLFGPRLSTEVFIGTSRPLYCDTPRSNWLREFLDAARSGDIETAGDGMLKIRGVADAIFAKHHAKGSHEVALTKAVTGFFGMATGPVRPPLSYPAAAEIGEARRVLVQAGVLGAERAPELVAR
jgi:4-hydroxy-tetrahydrodipicolinate synthase